MKYAIVIVTYNRCESLKRSVETLKASVSKKDQVDLIISIDKSNTDVVEKFAEQCTWSNGDFIIAKHKENLGLRKHILSIGIYLDKYDALVVLEDDITVVDGFFNYVTQCVEKYQNDVRIAGISLYNFNVSYQTRLPFIPLKSEYDVYMMNCAMSWGQVWMKKQWKDFIEWYEHNNEEFNLPYLPQNINSWSEKSWLKYHTRYCIENNKYFVFPYYALATNNSEVGMHVKSAETVFQSELQGIPVNEYRLPTFEECRIKYDGFFEPKFIAQCLGLKEEDVCVDLNGMKSKCLYKRYLLSMDILPYKVIRSYGLQLYPIEMNIIQGREGLEIRLYDTQVSDKLTGRSNSVYYYKYLYRDALPKVKSILGIRGIMQILKEKLL